jgi:hypothetical protein
MVFQSFTDPNELLSPPPCGEEAGGGGLLGMRDADGAYRFTAPLTLPSPHKGERGARQLHQGFFQ